MVVIGSLRNVLFIMIIMKIEKGTYFHFIDIYANETVSILITRHHY